MDFTEYFGDIAAGELHVHIKRRSYKTVRGTVYSCEKCGSLVAEDYRATHVADHEATLKLVHDLHSAAHHHLGTNA